MESTRWIAVSSVVLLLGCREEQPSSDRVAIHSELVEQVCRGTIVHAESELARMEAELELAPMSEQVEIHVVDAETIGEYCEPNEDYCVIQPPRRLYVSAEWYSSVLTRELVRDRLARSEVGSTKPAFSEGLATALTRPMCAAEPGWNPPTVDQVLSKSLGTSLSEKELYVAGELLRWLLDTRGPDTVLDFMATLDRHDRPNEVRVAYLERFGSALELDLYAHWRPAGEPLEPQRAGCVAPELLRDNVRSRLVLDATFDCDSELVRNSFSQPGQAFVEWTLTIDESTAGTYHLEDQLPEGVAITITTCECQWNWTWTESPPGDAILWESDGGFHPEYGASLTPGVYRVRAYGPIGSSLDYEIVAPCDYAEQNCPDEQQCTPYGKCEDEVEDPGQLGDPCWPPYGAAEAPLSCDSGLICIGPYTLESGGICMTYCGEASDMSCPDGLSCEAGGAACAEACDPFAPICDQDWSCIPTLETGSGGCYPIPSAGLGLLETCSMLDFACAPGLVCENHEELDGCHSPDPDDWFDFSGCCTPICDPAAPDPGCPPEFPNCEANEGAVLGTCQP